MSKATPQRPEEGFRSLSVDWQVPSDAIASYATNFVLQRLAHEYLISFFQIQPPLLMGTPDQVVKQIAQLTNVSARLVGQIMIAEERLPELITLLQQGPALAAPAESGVPTVPQR